MPAIAAVLLFIGLIPNLPYGYYVFLRWAVCILCGLQMTAIAHDKSNRGWLWAFAVIAVIFNPLIPIHLKKDVWQVVDFCTGVVLLISLIIYRKTKL